MSATAAVKTYTVEEVAKHNQRNDAWLIIEDKVYDITQWQKRHPGGIVISYYKGNDATEVVQAFHPNREKLEHFLKKVYIGQLQPPSKTLPIIKDFRELRAKFVKEGLFKSDKTWFMLQVVQIVIMELLAAAIVYKWGNHSWLAWIIAVVLLGTSQIQAGWSQHDYGHLSVFKSVSMNNFVHQFLIGFIKGASASWWKTRHNRHHAKTNVLHKDPDIHNWPLFLFSVNMVSWNLGWVGTPFQHIYWFIFGPPLVATVLFPFQVIRHVFFKRIIVSDAISLVLFFVRWFGTYGPLLGTMGAWKLYWAVRLFDSLWFTWITSMNHLPKPIEKDKDYDWVSLHVITTQNVHQSQFTDWFTGHLNFQIEHHLFPLMPRHNYYKAQPEVDKLCAKYGLKPVRVSLLQALGSIVGSLADVAKAYSKQRSLQEKAN